MAQKKTNLRERQIGKKPPEKKHLIDPRYKSLFWTIVIVTILIIFFIINNTRQVPETGPYPPYYKKDTGSAGNSNNQLNYGYDKSN
jgi:hypothetical protein